LERDDDPASFGVARRVGPVDAVDTARDTLGDRGDVPRPSSRRIASAAPSST